MILGLSRHFKHVKRLKRVILNITSMNTKKEPPSWNLRESFPKMRQKRLLMTISSLPLSLRSILNHKGFDSLNREREEKVGATLPFFCSLLRGPIGGHRLFQALVLFIEIIKSTHQFWKQEASKVRKFYVPMHITHILKKRRTIQKA